MEDMEKKLRIALGSCCSKPGEVQENLEQIRHFAQQAAANQCHVLLTPELSVTGYGGYDCVLACAEIPGEGPIFRALKEISRESGVVLLCGFVEQDAENAQRKYLAHYIVFPDGNFTVQRKHRVTPLEAPLSPAVPLYFDGSEEIGQVREEEVRFSFFHINGLKCVVVICADAGIPHLHELLDRHQVDVMFLPVGAGGERKNKVTSQELLVKNGTAGIEKFISLCNNEYFYPQGSVRDSILHDRAIAAVNMCGYDGIRLYHGGSGSVVDQYGQITAHLCGIENLDRQRPGFAFGEVDFSSRLGNRKERG